MKKICEHLSRSFNSNFIVQLLLAVLLWSVLITGCDLTNQQAVESQEQKWFKGNLHTHSYWSNGDDYPEMVLDWYQKRGYDFVALSEHDIIAFGDRQISVPKGTQKEDVFREYLDTYGEEWVEYTDNDSVLSVQLKNVDEYRNQFEDEDGFLVFQSEEIHDDYNEVPVHVNATNIQERISPRGGSSILSTLQNNIDAVLNQEDETSTTIFKQVNHPNIGWAVSPDDLKEVRGPRFYELYSGHPNANNQGDSVHRSTEQKWDEANTFRAQQNLPLFYALAVDDAQDYHSFGPNRVNPGRGWIQVRTSVLSPDSIMQAMQRGDFYASNGVRLKEVKFNGDTLSVSIDIQSGVSYVTSFIGALEGQPDKPGVELAKVEGGEASYVLRGDELYVRAKIVSDKKKTNPRRNEEGTNEVAWTQPVMQDN